MITAMLMTTIMGTTMRRAAAIIFTITITITITITHIRMAMRGMTMNTVMVMRTVIPMAIRTIMGTTMSMVSATTTAAKNACLAPCC